MKTAMKLMCLVLALLVFSTRTAYSDGFIEKALAEGYQDSWNYSSYTGFYDLEDCQNYLILFLSKTIGLTVDDFIQLSSEEDYLEEGSYHFDVWSAGASDSEVLTYSIQVDNFHIRDRHGELLNPDGWPWPEPAKVLTQEQAENRLYASTAATYFKRHSDKDKMDGDIKIYCYAMFFGGDESGKHLGYAWVHSITGEIEREEF
jgi:hypothetical protein